mgnify:FL=1
MTGRRVLEDVLEILERWGWVQNTDRSPDGFDLVAAFEEVCGFPLRDTTVEEDSVIAAFADPSCDAALCKFAHVIGVDPADGPIDDERWAWVHVVTVFNDRPSQSWPVVRRSLHEARSTLRDAEVRASS